MRGARPAVVVALFLAIASLQLIPLPRGIVQALSPATSA